MTNLITEARELCEKWSLSDYAVFECEDCIANMVIYKVVELCDALEKAEEQNKQLVRELSKLACESVERGVALARLEAEVEDALREQAEREKGCEYCQQGEEMAYGKDGMQREGYIYLDGNLLTADLYSESMAVAVCFCPMCGKRLEVKHEDD